MAEENAPERYPKRHRKPVVKEFSSTAGRNQKRWSRQEKELLNSALRKYGDHDLVLLAAKVGTKTPTHVHSYLTMHKQASAEESKPGRTERLERLHRWVEHIRAQKQKNPLPKPAALSMLMIALLEDHPVPTDGEVNFNEAYNYMFELLSARHAERWKQGANLSDPTLRFIKLSTLKLIKTALNRMDDFKRKLPESADTPDLFSGKNSDHLPGPVRRLVLHKHLNPLRLNEESTDSRILLGHQDGLFDHSNPETNSETATMDTVP